MSHDQSTEIKYSLKIVSAKTEGVQTRKYSFDYEAVPISMPVQGQFFAIITIISLRGSGFHPNPQRRWYTSHGGCRI